MNAMLKLHQEKGHEWARGLVVVVGNQQHAQEMYVSVFIFFASE